ncbi:MAG TPA: hypothetical protein PKD85_10815 [Saprospiraceae bacterium]|nr:hypothetical protein [Saprospiraceae bacterium]
MENFQKGTGLERQIPVIFTGDSFNFEKKNKFKEIIMTLYIMHVEIAKVRLPMNAEASATEILGTVQLITLRALNEGEKKVIKKNDKVTIRFLTTSVEINVRNEDATGKTDEEIVREYALKSLIPYLVVNADLVA